MKVGKIISEVTDNALTVDTRHETNSGSIDIIASTVSSCSLWCEEMSGQCICLASVVAWLTIDSEIIVQKHCVLSLQTIGRVDWDVFLWTKNANRRIVVWSEGSSIHISFYGIFAKASISICNCAVELQCSGCVCVCNCFFVSIWKDVWHYCSSATIWSIWNNIQKWIAVCKQLFWTRKGFNLVKCQFTFRWPVPASIFLQKII